MKHPKLPNIPTGVRYVDNTYFIPKIGGYEQAKETMDEDVRVVAISQTMWVGREAIKDVRKAGVYIPEPPPLPVADPVGEADEPA